MKKIESKDGEEFEKFESVDNEDIFNLPEDEILDRMRQELREEEGDQE